MELVDGRISVESNAYGSADQELALSQKEDLDLYVYVFGHGGSIFYAVLHTHTFSALSAGPLNATGFTLPGGVFQSKLKDRG